MSLAKLVAVVPVRKGSQRVKNKNLRKFSDTNLLTFKIETLKKVKRIDKIIINTDSEEAIEIAKKNNVDYKVREKYYASSECTNSEFHRHIGEVTESEDIFLAPVCSPFVEIDTHIEAIKVYKEEGYDSLTSVTEVKNHLWMDGHPLNYDLENVPNSQDLPDVVKLNYGITIAKRKVMKDLGRVVGDNPGFLKISERESIDIDTNFDLQVARGIINER